jgi:hypothetical protein
MNLESFLAGHVHAFGFLHGVPTVITYDNLKAAVYKVLTGRERQEQQRFIDFRKHYLFDSRYCMVRSPEEKGGVENGVGYYRHNFFTGIRKAPNLERLNQDLVAACSREGERVQQRRNISIDAAFDNERPHLRPLPRFPYDCCRIKFANASAFQLVQFDKNRYSVPSRYALRRHLVVRGYYDRIVVAWGDEVIAEHDRLYGEWEESFDAFHYVPQLKTKPGLLERGKPFVRWKMPDVLARYRQALRERYSAGGTREFVRVLLAVGRHKPEDLETAVALAMEAGTLDPDAVLAILQAPTVRTEPGRLDLTSRPDLAGVVVPLPTLKRYDRLLQAETTQKVS